MKINYSTQLFLTVVIIIGFNILTTLCSHWIFHSIGLCLCGLLWIVNPVMKDNSPPTQIQKNIIRISGGIVILLGIFTRAYYY